MTTVLIIGGTRFIGRATVEEFLAHDYDVAIANRGNHENPYADHPDVRHVTCDRQDDDALVAARDAVDPDVVIDCVAYYPRDVEVATDVFADCEAYVYISSGAAYGVEEAPKREDDTPLHPCTDEQATSDDHETYGPRKAEGDRAIFAAAERGVRAMAIRPPIVYGPHDYTERFDYWVDRVLNHDRVIVPYTELRHLVYVGDVASALRVIAEEGTAGNVYNVGDHTLPLLTEWVELLADEAGRDIELFRAGERELAAAEIEPADFPLFRSYPHVLDTNRLESLGWEATPIEETVAATVAEHRESDRTGRENGPDREDEERVLDVLATMR